MLRAEQWEKLKQLPRARSQLKRVYEAPRAHGAGGSRARGAGGARRGGRRARARRVSARIFLEWISGLVRGVRGWEVPKFLGVSVLFMCKREILAGGCYDLHLVFRGQIQFFY